MITIEFITIKRIMELLLWHILNNNYIIQVYVELVWQKLKNDSFRWCHMCGQRRNLKRYTNKWYNSCNNTYHICIKCLEYVITRNVIGKANGTDVIIRPISLISSMCRCGNGAKWVVRHQCNGYSYTTEICDECADKKYHRQ